jgi:hypothetical protein
MPTTTAIGVAKPKAHGQAMINTVTALTIPYANRLSLEVKMAQVKNVSTLANNTAGTNHSATRSTMVCIGMRLRWDSPTSRTI